MRGEHAGEIAPSKAGDGNFVLLAFALALCAMLRIVHEIQGRSATAWFVGVLAFAAFMCRARYSQSDCPVLRLWRLLAVLSGLYGLIHYPLMPALGGVTPQIWYFILIVFWIAASIAAIACYRVASLALIPPAYLVWSALSAVHVTGLPHGNILDIMPLAEVSMCLAVGLFLKYRLLAISTRQWAPEILKASVDRLNDRTPSIILWLAICVHLANYFWSAVAKYELPGPWLAWVRFNNPLYIFLTAADDNHIVFSTYSWVTKAVMAGLDQGHLITNLVVFTAQAVAVAGMLLPKRVLLALLIVFDTMHLAIAVAAGANFWPWVLLNVAIAAVVARSDYIQPDKLVGAGCALFILVAPRFADVARLGWYDAGANNRVALYAEDTSGHQYYVSPNYFTFYSYPIGHMDYGYPGPATAFGTGHPNGGAYSYAMLLAGRQCDVPALVNASYKSATPLAFAQFVTNYAALAANIRSVIGVFPYWFYPHHFYEPWSVEAPFDALDKRTIVAYVYRRESVCLSYRSGVVTRRLVSSADMRIEVPRD